MTSWPLVTIGGSIPPQPSCGRVVDLPPPLLAGDVDEHSVSSVSARAMSVPTVGMAMPMRITAGRIVSPISSAGRPWVCLGIGWPRSR